MTVELGRISTLIENRYLALAREARRTWGLKGTGPRLAVETHTPETATFMLRGRTRTLANRRYEWEHEGGDGTLEELLGHPAACKPLDRRLAGFAMTQALRAAMAADLGLGVRSMPETRLMIDRFLGMTLMRKHGDGILGEMARAARKADGDEKDPNSQITMTNCGQIQFGVASCDVDMDEDVVRRPEIRPSAHPMRKGAEYIHGRLHIMDANIPETLMMAAAGRPLRDIVDTGTPLLADRIVKQVYKAGETLIVRLVDDMVEIGEITA